MSKQEKRIDGKTTGTGTMLQYGNLNIALPICCMYGTYYVVVEACVSYR
jgi:hypothetical protein